MLAQIMGSWCTRGWLTPDRPRAAAPVTAEVQAGTVGR